MNRRRRRLLRALGGSAPSLTLHQDFLNATTLAEAAVVGPTLTFTRASSATYFDSSGVLQTATTNVPRFDHNLSGTALGLLIEESRTNRLLHCRDWTNAAYTASNITVAKDATGLDGVANSASTLTATGANGTILQSITLTSAARTFSIYVKRVTGTGNIDITDNGGTNWTTLTGLSASDWTRHQITRTQANPNVGVRIVTSGDEVEVDFGQVEDGSFPTSPIATTTAAVVRAADVCSTSDVDWLNASAGTLFVQAQSPALATLGPLASIGSGLNDRLVQMAREASNAFGFFSRANGVTVVNESNAAWAWTANTPMKAAMAYALNDFAGASTGELRFTDTSAALATANKLAVGARIDDATPINGHIQVIKYWNGRQSNTFLQTETA